LPQLPADLEWNSRFNRSDIFDVVVGGVGDAFVV
jgi:hypothetical protein